MAQTLSFSSSGRHSSMRIFISRSELRGGSWLLPTRRWLARGLRPGIVSEIHLAFLHPPNSQGVSGKGRACHGKRVLHCGSPGPGQLRFERWSPSGSSCSKGNYLISPRKVFRKAQSPSNPSAFRKSHNTAASRGTVGPSASNWKFRGHKADTQVEMRYMKHPAVLTSVSLNFFLRFI